MDARHFQMAFPDQPLIGFYAGGEIGPQAVAFQEKGFVSVERVEDYDKISLLICYYLFYKYYQFV